MNENVEETFRLTPKGFLSYCLSKHCKAKITVAALNAIWNDLAHFVGDVAKEDGFPDGLPCLIFEEGGKCAKVCRKEEKCSQPSE